MPAVEAGRGFALAPVSPEERIGIRRAGSAFPGATGIAAAIAWLGMLAALYALPSREAPPEVSGITVELHMVPSAEEGAASDPTPTDPAETTAPAAAATAQAESIPFLSEEPPAIVEPVRREASALPPPLPRQPPPLPGAKPRPPVGGAPPDTSGAASAAAPEASGTSVAALPPAPTVTSGHEAAPRAAADYEGRLLAHLARHQDYPRSARQRGLEGKVVLRLVVARDGRVVDVAVRAGSGKDVLDAGALSTVARAGRLPPLPPELAGETIEFAVPVVFSLSRR